MNVDGIDFQSDSWSQDQESVLRRPYDYLALNPGKQNRRIVLESFNRLIRCPTHKLEIVTKVVQILHDVSLLIDDVEDHATLRRGQPAAHIKFGVPTTINSSTYMVFVAQNQLRDMETGELQSRVYEIFTEGLLTLHRGQGLDIYWRDEHICPTEDEYFQMVIDKTGGIFRMAVRLMELGAGCCEPFSPLESVANLLGAIYQIRDDYCNLKSTKFTSSKGFCEDLTEGKFSFPVIHAVHTGKDPSKLLEILSLHTDDEKLKQWALDYMEDETGSFEYTRQTLRNLTQKGNYLIEKCSRYVQDDTQALDALRAVLQRMADVTNV